MKERLDVLLVEKGFFPSREQAKASLMAGLVTVDGRLADKPGMQVDTEAVIAIKEVLCPFVSRGGLKLKKALEEFGLSVKDAVGVDMGASTGGFTDCMLQNGAVKVYSIDVGYGQLDWKLRQDPRVVNMEKTNIRYMDPAVIEEKADIISIDVSFISVNLIFPVARAVIKDGGNMVCLVKPQFEAGREQIGKGGIVKKKEVHIEVIEKVAAYGVKAGFKPAGLSWSPVTGAKGNIEYLMHLVPAAPEELAELTEGEEPVPFLDPVLVLSIVDQAHESLNEKNA
ncbi:MAG: TlyA family RNA methyltransferase [Firmicutes bacterium]|nr:TlyA family RNA methyltransferase [Bacillota bacterium]